MFNLCIKKYCEDKHIDLSVICEGKKKHCALIKDFNAFIHQFITSWNKKLLSLLFASF